MTELALQPAQVEAFARAARKAIERRIIQREADSAAFWLAVAQLYRREPSSSRTLARL